jgi:hypothetical protein
MAAAALVMKYGKVGYAAQYEHETNLLAQAAHHIKGADMYHATIGGFCPDFANQYKLTYTYNPIINGKVKAGHAFYDSTQLAGHRNCKPKTWDEAMATIHGRKIGKNDEMDVGIPKAVSRAASEVSGLISRALGGMEF